MDYWIAVTFYVILVANFTVEYNLDRYPPGAHYVERQICPMQCTCTFETFEKTWSINCGSLGMESLPLLANTYSNPKRTEVMFQHNKLRRGPTADMGYVNVTTLILSHNLLETFVWMPPHIEVLKLDNNRLTYLGVTIARALISQRRLHTLSLHNNLWKCGCSVVFVKEVIMQLNEIMEESKLSCQDSRLVQDYIPHMFCMYTPRDRLSVYVIFLVSGITVVIFAWVLCQICVWRLSVTHDFFISYVQEDEDFVLRYLVPFFNKNWTSAILFKHTQNNFSPYFIMKGITRARKMIIIFSKDYSKKVWANKKLKRTLTCPLQFRQTTFVVAMDHAHKKIFPKMKLSKEVIFLHKDDELFWWKIQLYDR